MYSPNAIIHVDQTSNPGIAAAVNSYYAMECKLPAPPSAELNNTVRPINNPLVMF